MCRSIRSKDKIKRSLNLLIPLPPTTSFSFQQVHGHQGIVEYRSSFEFNNKLWVEMEYCSGGSLNSFFWEKKPQKTTKHRLLIELASAVAFLHEHDVVHRDLKPDNVLISYDEDCIPHIKVADFGLAKAIASSSLQGDLDQYYMHSGVGTTYYMAPEVFNKKYTLKADIHAMGLIFMSLIRETHIGNQLLTYVPVHGGSKWPIGKYQNYTELNIKVNPKANVGENIRSLLLQMLLYNYKQRPTAVEVRDYLLNETTPDDLDSQPHLRELTTNPAPGDEEALALKQATPVYEDDDIDSNERLTSYSLEF